MQDAKAKLMEIHRAQLLGQLESLKSRIENPYLTREQLDAIKEEAAECQKKLKEILEPHFSPTPQS